MIENADLIMKFRLSPSMAKILMLLLENKRVSARMIENDLKIVTDTKVAIHRIRRRLENTGIEIQSRREVGYWLDDTSKTVLYEALGQQAPAVSAGEGETSA